MTAQAMTTQPSLTLPPGPAWLFVPADRPDRWSKAAQRADSVIVDLENAVAPSGKDRARDALVDVCSLVDSGRLIVRVNPRETQWYGDDVAAVRAAGVRVVMVPKVRDAGDIAQAAVDLPGTGLVALCETASSILAAEAIASVDACVALMWGGEDLAVDLGASGSHTPDGALTEAMSFARTRLRFGARAGGAAALDAPVLRIDRPEWVTREAGEVADLGFHAKTCIHPDHVALVRGAFRPTEEEIARARAIVEAVDAQTGEPGATEVAVFSLDGQMVDFPVIALARRLLHRVNRSADEDSAHQDRAQ